MHFLKRPAADQIMFSAAIDQMESNDWQTQTQMQATVIKAEYRVSTQAFARPDRQTDKSNTHGEKKGERGGSVRKIYR